MKQKCGLKCLTNFKIKHCEKSKYSQTKQIHNAYCIMLPHHFKALQLLVYVFKKHTSLTIYYNCKHKKKFSYYT